jgi:hypothetical protein
MPSSEVPESNSTPDESDVDERTSGHGTTEGDPEYHEGIFEQGKERPGHEPGQGVFEQGHDAPGGEGVFQQGHVEREQGSGIYDQDDEKPVADN